MDIRELPISNRLLNALRSKGISDTEDIKKFDSYDLRRIRNIGASSMRELRVLREKGIIQFEDYLNPQFTPDTNFIIEQKDIALQNAQNEIKRYQDTIIQYQKELKAQRGEIGSLRAKLSEYPEEVSRKAAQADGRSKCTTLCPLYYNCNIIGQYPNSLGSKIAQLCSRKFREGYRKGYNRRKREEKQ